MKRLFFFLIITCLLLLPGRLQAAPTLQYQGEVSSPRPNAVLRGQIVINGTANHPDFWKYEIRVVSGLNRNASDDQWLRLVVREQAVVNNQLAVWDTTLVPDGVYTLRLRVVRRDGNWQDFDIQPLSVANVVPPTATDSPPTEPPGTPTPDPSLSPTPANSPTPLASPTPFFVPTLTPSGAEPLPTSPANAASPTPILIDQPTSVALAASPEPTESGAEDGATVATPPPTDNPLLPGVPVNLEEELDVNQLTAACIQGAAITIGIFLLVGALYLLRLLLRSIR